MTETSDHINNQTCLILYSVVIALLYRTCQKMIQKYIMKKQGNENFRVELKFITNSIINQLQKRKWNAIQVNELITVTLYLSLKIS